MLLKGEHSPSDFKNQQVQDRLERGPKEDSKHVFITAIEQPYAEAEGFHCLDGYEIGGRSLTCIMPLFGLFVSSL